MAQRVFRSDDSDKWLDFFGDGSAGNSTVSTSTDATPNTTITGTSGTKSATIGSGTGFANGNLVLIHQSQQGGNPGGWELNKISSGGGTTSLTLTYNLTNTYGSGAQIYLLKKYRNVTISSGQTLTGQTWGGSVGGILAILANDSITVAGTITVGGIGFRGGSTVTNSSTAGIQGESTTGIGTNSTSANGMGGGGGASGTNGSHGSSAGGGGGGVGSGTNGSVDDHGNAGGSGGSSGGNAGITLAPFGGAGASGGGINEATSSGVGGNSGGFILLIAPTITVTGSVTANGSVGTQGGNPTGGGGGGAGGCVLIKAQTAALGSSLVTATGGAGGLNNGWSGSGGAGSNGYIHADYGVGGVSGTTNPSLDSRSDRQVSLPLVVFDTVTISEVIKKITSRKFTDTVTISEAFSTIRIKVVSFFEKITITDTFVRRLNGMSTIWKKIPKP